MMETSKPGTLGVAFVCNHLIELMSSQINPDEVSPTNRVKDIASLIAKLEVRIKGILNIYPRQEALLSILADFGWELIEGRFIPGKTIDLERLRDALQKKSGKLSRRIWRLQLKEGVESSSTSFLPGLLLRCIANKVSTEIVKEAEDHHDHSLDLLGTSSTMTNIELKPCSAFFTGICMIVDISGFAKISEQYFDSKKEGIDALQRATNGYIGRLVEIIYCYGGDIMKFDGDAILCVFYGGENARKVAELFLHPKEDNRIEVDEGVLSDIALNAMICAMELRTITTNLLSVHIALSVGEMCFGIIGGVLDRWENLLSGKCVFQLSQCLKDAPAKNIAITPELAILLGDELMKAFDGLRLDTGNYLIQQKPNLETSFQARDRKSDASNGKSWSSICASLPYINCVDKFVPTPVLHACNNKALRYLSEIREVTTMFMKWTSYHPDNNKDVTSLQPYYEKVQTILYEQGAFLRQLIVNDKGCMLVACWGVPTSSYLDNSLRALRAAISIRKQLRDMDMETCFGISTGNVFCGNMGNEIRQEYSLVGETVIFASRLTSDLKPGIFIDEATHSRLSFEMAELFTEFYGSEVGNSDKNVGCVHELISENMPEIVESFIEENEIKHDCKIALRRNLDRLCKQSRKGIINQTGSKKSTSNLLRFIMLEGKVGTGKRTAVRWLIHQAQKRNVTTLIVRLESKDTFMQYWMLSKLFSLLIDHNPLDHVSKQKTQVMAFLTRAFGDSFDKIFNMAMPALKNLFGMRFIYDEGEGPPVEKSHSTSKAYREALYEIFCYLFNEKAVMIIIENIHFADEESLKVLLSFKAMVARSVLMFTALDFEHAILRQEVVGVRNAKGRTKPKLVTMEWYKKFHHTLSQNENTTLITLDDFNISEIDAILVAALHDDHLPLQLARCVHQLSGGSIFLINEIIEFLKVSSIQDFIKMVEDAPPVTKQKHRLSIARPPLDNPAAISSRETATTKEEGDRSFEKSLSKSSLRVSSLVPPPLTIPAKSSIPGVEPETSSEADDPFEASRAKLYLCIIHRFEKLEPDTQQVLKTASVIGMEFSREVLSGVLPTALKSITSTVLKQLTKEQWITPNQGEDIGYTFNHPLVHSSILSLLPSGDSNFIHRLVAECLIEINNTNGDDATTCSDISYHYSFCNNSKAFEYCVKAADLYIYEDIESCLAMLNCCMGYCRTVIDIKTVQKVKDALTYEIFTAESNIRRQKELEKNPQPIKNPQVRPPETAAESKQPETSGAQTATNAFSGSGIARVIGSMKGTVHTETTTTSKMGFGWFSCFGSGVTNSGKSSKSVHPAEPLSNGIPNKSGAGAASGVKAALVKEPLISGLLSRQGSLGPRQESSLSKGTDPHGSGEHNSVSSSTASNISEEQREAAFKGLEALQQQLTVLFELFSHEGRNDPPEPWQQRFLKETNASTANKRSAIQKRTSQTHLTSLSSGNWADLGSL